VSRFLFYHWTRCGKFHHVCPHGFERSCPNAIFLLSIFCRSLSGTAGPLRHRKHLLEPLWKCSTNLPNPRSHSCASSDSLLFPQKSFRWFLLFKTGFAAESGQIRKNQTFSNLRGLNLCTSHILVFGCFHGQDVVGSLKKVAEKIPCTKIIWCYLRRYLHRVIGSRRHLCPKSPETFESKLSLYWLKEP